MDITRAKEIVHTLASGVDPTTGELLPKESVLESPDVIRALYTLLEAVQTDSKAVHSMSRDGLQNAGNPWTVEEETHLKDEFQKRMKISDIAKAHGRTKGAIESRLKYMGMKE
ncbi:MAG: hypothetical protein E7458_04115 [Ruminococcaceae bacterium]|nr:hypothetical protein [Oscillospiraceae bacterium]